MNVFKLILIFILTIPMTSYASYITEQQKRSEENKRILNKRIYDANNAIDKAKKNIHYIAKETVLNKTQNDAITAQNDNKTQKTRTGSTQPNTIARSCYLLIFTPKTEKYKADINFNKALDVIKNAERYQSYKLEKALDVIASREQKTICDLAQEVKKIKNATKNINHASDLLDILDSFDIN